ncbi:hypothetical protein Zmor_004133 [Zophobas morio]|uniref:Uncharacterized protein n=1 Tax=Zophobas morio TaxID=2755281 RepID=A0AA38HJH1_9CUCU|nr:hypothetical protein Zmor_004133 [Zophobas morio]
MAWWPAKRATCSGDTVQPLRSTQVITIRPGLQHERRRCSVVASLSHGGTPARSLTTNRALDTSNTPLPVRLHTRVAIYTYSMLIYFSPEGSPPSTQLRAGGFIQRRNAMSFQHR